MWTALLGFLTAFPKIVTLIEQFVAIRKAEARLEWAQSLQTGLQPLEQGLPTTDDQKYAAVKAVADAWASMK